MAEKKQDWSHWRVFKVWILLWYYSRIVSDGPALTSVFSTYDKALEGAATIIITWLQEDGRIDKDDEDVKAVRALIQVGSLEEAIERFREVAPDQRFEITARDVDALTEPN